MVYRCAAAFSWVKEKKRKIFMENLFKNIMWCGCLFDGAATFLFYIPRGKIDETDLLCVLYGYNMYGRSVRILKVVCIWKYVWKKIKIDTHSPIWNVLDSVLAAQEMR